MDTDNLIVYVESKDICTDLTGNNKKGFDTYNYEVKRPLPIGKNEKKIDLMKDELGGEIMKEL